MQPDLINKQLLRMTPLLLGKKIQKIESYKDCIFRIFITESDEVIYFSLKKPFLFFDIFLKNHPIHECTFQECSVLKKAINQKITSGFFDAALNRIHLVLEDSDLVIEFKEGGRVLMGLKSSYLDKQKESSFLEDEEKQYLVHVKESLANFLLKEKNKFFIKKQKTLEKLENELVSLDQKIGFLNETITFIYENQNNWDSKDSDFLKKKTFFSIPPRIDVGTVLNRCYKELKKLKKKKIKIPLVIAEYQHKQPLAEFDTFSKKASKEAQPNAFCRLFRTSLNEVIWVGRNAKENDAISFKYSHGNDFWFHANNYPGAHVVIHHDNPSFEAITKARLLAKYFSKAKDEKKAEVVETQVKFLKKGKALGEVFLSKQKVVLVEHDPILISQLFGNLLP